MKRTYPEGRTYPGFRDIGRRRSHITETTGSVNWIYLHQGGRWDSVVLGIVQVRWSNHRVMFLTVSP